MSLHCWRLVPMRWRTVRSCAVCPCSHTSEDASGRRKALCHGTSDNRQSPQCCWHCVLSSYACLLGVFGSRTMHLRMQLTWYRLFLDHFKPCQTDEGVPHACDTVAVVIQRSNAHSEASGGSCSVVKFRRYVEPLGLALERLAGSDIKALRIWELSELP